MGMFDTYHPDGPLHCPVCAAPLHEWQGRDGPNALLHWRQGESDPFACDQQDEDLVDPDVGLTGWSLPPRFSFYCYDCACPYPVDAIGECEHGVWRRTVLVDAANARQRKHETRAQWSARQRWLRGLARR
ncbi:hypothetical protein [Lysobacter sp. CA199]|uniref:hypothetical protein n=1 Tax=Lysobacter sp. CA199 TaxID=3455608 RepID=UPI003F8D4D40